jgi:hypothetical protein
MIIRITLDQSEWIEFALTHLNHKPLAHRFAHGAQRALLTEAEVQLVIEALEEEQTEVECSLENMQGDLEPPPEKEIKASRWDLELIGSAIDSLKSQLAGGDPVEPDETDF